VARPKKETVEVQTDTGNTIPSVNDLGWTDYVLSLLSEDEKISGNPTTDGLRRVFEIALNCIIISADTNVVQSPSPENEKRATVTHTLTYILNDESVPSELKMRSATGAADVYWGNCDKIYRNHPVAVAETRAEGRALRRALKLRKVVAAEELAKEIEDHPDENSTNKISSNQVNFIDVLAKRLNINVRELLLDLAVDPTNIYEVSHDNAITVIRELSKHQQNLENIPSKILGYDSSWR
jgi:hypothetical protein